MDPLDCWTDDLKPWVDEDGRETKLAGQVDECGDDDDDTVSRTMGFNTIRRAAGLLSQSYTFAW